MRRRIKSSTSSERPQLWEICEPTPEARHGLDLVHCIFWTRKQNADRKKGIHYKCTANVTANFLHVYRPFDGLRDCWQCAAATLVTEGGRIPSSVTQI